MKIYNKKGFISGLIGLLLSWADLMLMLVKEFSMKYLIMGLFLFAFSITEITRSLSKKKTIEDMTINNDEREKYIQLKSSQKSFQIIEIINCTFLILFIIIYSITKKQVLIPFILITSLYITISFIALLITNIYYERHV